MNKKEYSCPKSCTDCNHFTGTNEININEPDYYEWECDFSEEKLEKQSPGIFKNSPYDDYAVFCNLYDDSLLEINVPDISVYEKYQELYG